MLLLFFLSFHYRLSVQHWLSNADVLSLRDVLELLSVLKHHWSQVAPNMSMPLASVFQQVQGSCSSLFFAAWKLSQEYSKAQEWYQAHQPPTMLAMEQQELTSDGRFVWQPIKGKVQLVLGVPVRLRCWIWGAHAHQCKWSLMNGADLAAAPRLCPHNNVFKSEAVITVPGTYQCVGTSTDGECSQPISVEV